MATTTQPAESHAPAAQAAGSQVDLAWIEKKIPYRRYQECVHCGLCTASCPTYLETRDENDSPRGRIYLMRAVVDGRLAMGPGVREHLELCLDCRACESACPSGVRYGHMIEPFKIALHQAAAPGSDSGLIERFLMRNVFPYRDRVKLALAPARILQRMGILDWSERSGLTKLLPGTLQRLTGMLPRLKRGEGALPEILPPIGPRRARVGLFLGCVGDAMLPATTHATARVLQHNGCEVVVPRGQGCCGAIHYHSGSEAPALELARKNIDVFQKAGVDAIVVNAAGCGAMLKDYAHILASSDGEPAAQFTAKVKDVCEFLAALGPVAPTGHVDLVATYHDACHLCHAQQVRAQPRSLLAMVPGLELVPLEESEICCGAAGTYNLTQPEMAERLGNRKLDNVEATGAKTVLTGNVGCILQIARHARARGMDLEVAHPIDILDRAYQAK